MTHREESLCYCIDQLQNRQLSYVFNQEIFNNVFEKENNPAANYYRIGITAADLMIENYIPTNEPENNE
jgi:hypothetical protein